MYYQLHPDYGWRGWEKLPYALLNTKTGNAVSMNGTEYGAMSLCDGVMDVDSIFVTDQQREMIRIYEKKGFVVPCRQGTELTEEQRYRRYPARYIKMAHWSITGRCNYRCRHCYMSAPDAKYGELDHETCMNIIQELADCGVQNVSITGGEPLVRKDFFELVDAMLDRGLHIRIIYSNGKLVTDHFLDELTARGLCPEINMSFDGVGWCDWLRGVDGAEEAVKDAFRRCRDKGFPTAAEMCLHQYNKHTLRESINLLASLGCRHLKTNPVSAVGEWKRHGGDASLSMKEAFDLYLDYIPHFFEDGAPLSLMLGGFFMARKGANT
ncbi:MAG: radical SAM protein, partial [Eubacteriaceae bacterium]|nr:radical SAM protein [Eubacteriaceae bacterium]